MLIKLCIIGACGRMGTELIKSINKSKKVALNSAVDALNNPYIGQDASLLIGSKNKLDILVTNDMETAICNCDMVIDFSNHTITQKVVNYAAQYNKSVVIGTTGNTQTDLDYIKEKAKSIKILQSSNMSLGVNTMLYLAKIASLALKNNNFGVSITDIHHKNKLDSPSGTAISIKNVVESVNNNAKVEVESIREGSIIGEHTLTFCGLGEQLEIKHIAKNRSIFAQGAIDAAIWLYNNKSSSGLFSLQDVVIANN